MKEKDVNTIVLTTMECNHVTDPIKTKLMFWRFFWNLHENCLPISGLKHCICKGTHPWLNANVLLRCCPVSYLDVWRRPLKRRSIVMSWNRIICRMIELCNEIFACMMCKYCWTRHKIVTFRNLCLAFAVWLLY
jgi:hypothetical protein